jgi:hypothetical protein
MEGVTVRALLHTSRTMRTLLTPGHYSETFEAMDTGMFIEYFSLYSVNVQCEGFAILTYGGDGHRP